MCARTYVAVSKQEGFEVIHYKDLNPDSCSFYLTGFYFVSVLTLFITES